MATITLSGMRFYAHHGCFEEERAIGTNFVVDIALSVDTQKAELSDDLDDTVNYADVYKCVKQQMDVPSKLLEHVARRIADAIKTSFPQVAGISVRVSKLNPPLGGQLTAAAVEITC